MKSVRILSVALAAVLFTPSAFAQTVEEGYKYLENEQYRQALTTFQSLATSNPSAENYYHLARYYFAVGEPELAKEQLNRALSEDDRSPYVYVGLGELELSRGNVAGAAPHFNRAKELSRNRNVDIFYQIGRAYVSHDAKNPQAAIAELNRAIEMDSRNPNYYIALGDAYLAANDASNASAKYEQALYADPNFAEAHVRIGDLLVRARSYNQALAKYQQAVAANPDYLPAHKSLGEIYFLARQYKNAATSYATYLSKADATPDAIFTYAGYLFLDGQYAQSLAELQKLGFDYPNPVMHRLLAYNYYETEQYDQGYEQIQTFFAEADTVEKLPSDFEYQGKLTIAAGQDTLAGIASLRQAIEADTSMWGLHKDIASLLFTMRRYEESGDEYETMEAKGMELSPTDYLNKGRGYYYAGQGIASRPAATAADSSARTAEASPFFTKADAAFTRLTELAPSHYAGWLWRARANVYLDPESTQGLARPYYEKFIEVANPSESRTDLITANYYLAYYHYLQNDYPTSQRYVEAVLALDPAHQGALALKEFFSANPTPPDQASAQ
jgi:tetratricopeptide (TPR) repeat protein